MKHRPLTHHQGPRPFSMLFRCRLQDYRDALESGESYRIIPAEAEVKAVARTREEHTAIRKAFKVTVKTAKAVWVAA